MLIFIHDREMRGGESDYGDGSYGTETKDTGITELSAYKNAERYGCRITKQRLMLLDIILEEDCSCCKEIYYKAAKQDGKIGTATVYRMVNKLEEIGAISRKNMYKIACGSGCEVENACIIEFDDDTVVELSAKKWHQVIKAGLVACGYPSDLNVRSVIAKSCQCGK